MAPLVLACMVLVVANSDGPTPPDRSVAREYAAEKAKAGRDPKSLVKLALWCEAHGLDAERGAHLAAAVLADPADATARGLLGMVNHGGRWLTPDAVGEAIRGDKDVSERLAQYERRREEALHPNGPRGRGRHPRGDLARAHIQLGMWCEKVGLKDEATAHFTSAVVIDPHNDASWKHLGYVRHGGRWMSHEQIAAERSEAEAQRKADAHWEPLLRKWKGWLSGGAEGRREEARTLLAGVTDPRAAASVVRVFADRRETDQLLAVQVLGQIDAPAASRALAELAVRSASVAVRSSAIGSLRPREPRDYAGQLVEMIRTPMTYQAEPVRGPGSPGGLIVETPRFRMLRKYDAPAAVRLGGARNGYIGYDGNGLPVAASHSEVDRLARDNPVQARSELARIESRTAEMIASANLKAESSQRRLIADIQAIEAANADIAAQNGRVIPVLEGALDAPADLKDDEDAWHTWWYDRIGYRYEAPRKAVLAVDASPQSPPPVIISCFAAGTPVRTLAGRRPIETLAVGDRVLTQETTTGNLSFQPVLVVHHNAPGAIVRIGFDDGDTLPASRYHRFWIAGRGWALARDLKVGDVVRTLGGRSRVVSLSEAREEPLFNLDVARGHTFFVGRRDALVHDNTPPELRIRPFDAAPEPANGGK